MHVVSGAILDRWTALTDEDIVARVLEGQTALYEVLMRRHNERIYRAARAVIRDEDEAGAHADPDMGQPCVQKTHFQDKLGNNR